MTRLRFFVIFMFFCSYVLFCENCHASSIVLKKSISLMEQVTIPNTEYVIKYRFDLGGETIILPDSCTLIFKKRGRIKNGLIKGVGIRIEGPSRMIFKNTLLSGSFYSTQAYPEWFGAKGDGKTDDTKSIERALCFHNVNLRPGKVYSVTSVILPSISDFSIVGDYSTIKCRMNSLEQVFNVIGNQDMSSVDASFQNGVFSMSGVIIDANANNYSWSIAPNPNGYNALALDNFRKVLIQDCYFKNTLMCGVRTTICDTVIVRDSRFENIGNDDGPISPYGWQWEGVSQTGMRYINGSTKNRLLRNCSLLEVSRCFFDNVLNSVAGAQNTKSIIISDNSCDRLHAFFSEFHINDSAKEKILSIVIDNNVIDRQAGALISLSGSFNGKENTNVTISNNEIKRFNGTSLPKYHVAEDKIMRHLLLLYRDSGESNISLLYDNNRVTSTSCNDLDTYIFLSGLRKALFSNSHFHISGKDSGMSTIFYSPFCELSIDNCSFVCDTNYDSFCAVNNYGVRITNTSIVNSKNNSSSIINIQNYDGKVISHILVEGLVVNSCRRLLFLNKIPKEVVIRNSEVGGDLGTSDFGNTKREKIDRVLIENTRATTNGLNSIPAVSRIIKNNVFSLDKTR